MFLIRIYVWNFNCCVDVQVPGTTIYYYVYDQYVYDFKCCIRPE